MRPTPAPIGSRVLHTLSGKAALVVGSSQPTANAICLVPVILEGSTRHELWPLHRLAQRPPVDQCAALGGRFQPPAGYPLIA